MSKKHYFNTVIKHIDEAKSEDALAEVVVLTANKVVSASFLDYLASLDLHYANIYIETTWQFVHRVTEHSRLAGGCQILDQTRAYFALLKKVGEAKLSYFHATSDFDSYTRYFLHFFRTLRLSASDTELAKVFNSNSIENKQKSKELRLLYKLYLDVKGNALDASDLLDLHVTCEPTIILSPDLKDDLHAKELKFLEQFENQVEVKLTDNDHVAVSLVNPIYSRQEVKEVFKDIIRQKRVLSDCVLVAPSEYYDQVFCEAKVAGLPLQMESGQLVNLNAGRVFLAVLDIIRNDFRFDDLQYYFQLQGQFGQMRELYECAVAVGYETLQNKIQSELKKRKSAIPFKEENITTLKMLSTTITSLVRCVKLQDNIAKLCQIIYKELMADDHQVAIVQSMTDRYSDCINATDSSDLNQLYDYLEQAIDSYPTNKSNKEGGLKVTSEYNVGLFKHVYVIGLDDKRHPHNHRDNPFLNDIERKAINKELDLHLPLSEEKNRQELKKLDLCLSSASQSFMASSPYLDVTDGKLAFMSYQLIGIMKLTEFYKNKNVNEANYKEFMHTAFRNIFSNDASDCLSLKDWYLYYLNQKNHSSFLGWALTNYSDVKAYLTSEKLEWSTEYNAYSGLLGEALGKVMKDERVYSTTSDLERLMRCPYSWFLSRVLYLKPLEEPVTVEELDNRQKGSLVHDILETYLVQNKNNAPSEKLLKKITAEKIAEQITSHGDIHPLLIEKARSEINNLVHVFMKYEESLPQSRKRTYFEMSFNKHEDDDFKPIEVKTKKAILKLGGKIDRVDIEDDVAYVIDYKSGSKNNYSADDYKGGKALQAAVYGEAVLQLLKDKHDLASVKSGFLALKGNAKGQADVVEYDQRKRDEFIAILDLFVDLIQNGVAFQTADCLYCNFTTICGSMVGYIAGKKLDHQKQSGKVKELVKRYQEVSGE